MKTRILLISMIVTAALSAGCAGTSSRGSGGEAVPIGTLLEDPGKYDDQNVMITGTVTGSASAFGEGAYTVDDGTGKLTVLTDEAAPAKGAAVTVRGDFQALYTIGDASGAVLREKGRTTS